MTIQSLSVAKAARRTGISDRLSSPSLDIRGDDGFEQTLAESVEQIRIEAWS